MPGRPEFKAISKSKASASRTSPTIIREGLIRRDSLIKRRSGISPSPCRFALRVCICTTSGNCGESSKTSSIVTNRSLRGIAPANALSNVVLPACVPPLTRMFNPARTELISVVPIKGLITPRFIRSSILIFLIRCLRMFTAQCCAVISGIATCKRLPSGKRASTKGCERSRRRPPHINARSTIFRTSSEVSSKFVSSLLPARAMKIRSGELIHTSSIVGSLI